MTLSDYLAAAMRLAEYEMIEDGEGFYGCIPAAQGVWANADSLEACRDELYSALEGWVSLGIECGHELPVFTKIN
jgi:predicted RNase H-like HicB family nuclease